MPNIKINIKVKEKQNSRDNYLCRNYSDKCTTNDSKKSVSDNELEKNKYILALVNDWIKNADNKNNIAFALLSTIVAVIVLVCDHLFSKKDLELLVSSWAIFGFLFFVILAGLFFIISIFFFTYSMSPRLDGKSNSKINKNSHVKKYSIFYDDIKNFDDENEFIKCALESDDSMLNEELLREIYYNSGICSKKMFGFKYGIRFSFLSISCVLLSSFVIFINNF